MHASKRCARLPASGSLLLGAFSFLNALSIALERINVAEAIALAKRAKLSLYDASYLWLAHALDAELVTLDDKLSRADKALRKVSE